MYLQGLDETIAAVATPAGAGGISIVKISGPGASMVLGRLCPCRREWPSHRMYLCPVLDSDTKKKLDLALAVFFQGPHSYTGEDVAELHCHGGSLVTALVLEAALRAGARPAAPGEFTFRAFVSGRIDLTMAEAVVDLVDARSRAAASLAMAHLSGGLRDELHALREQLTDLLTLVESSIDFVEEEDVSNVAATRVVEVAGDLSSRAAALLETYRSGRVMREGARVVLAGAPNVGKSSLFNALLRRSRALVCDLPHTTRDWIEESWEIGGVPVALIDTAGLGESLDPVQQAGMVASRDRLEEASLVLWVTDLSRPETLVPPPASLASSALVVANKVDMVKSSPEEHGVVKVSARTGQGLDRLMEELVSRLLPDASCMDQEAVAITRARHAEELEQVRDVLERAARGAAEGHPLELSASDLHEAVSGLNRLVGVDAPEEILERIFERFCIGK